MPVRRGWLRSDPGCWPCGKKKGLAVWIPARYKGRPAKAFCLNDLMAPFPPGIDTLHSPELVSIKTDAGFVRVYPGNWVVIDEYGRTIVEHDQTYIELIEVPTPPEEKKPAVVAEVDTDTPLIRLSGHFTSGSISGTVYTFAKGDGLPVHVHNAGMPNHITVVAKGALVCRGRPSIDGVVISAPDVIDWLPGEPHGFEALEDSVIVQVRKTA